MVDLFIGEMKMKYEKAITINIGNYESLRLCVSDAPSFEECDEEIKNELNRLGIEVDEHILKALEWAK